MFLASKNDPPPDPSNSWLARFVRAPWGTIHPVLNDIRTWLVIGGPAVGPAVAVGIAVAIVVARRWQLHRLTRLVADARTITIAPPPHVDPAGGPALWSALLGLIRPRWKRLLLGQPHVAFEYVFTHDGVRLQLWVPGSVPPNLAERAIEAVWPGARTHTRPATAPIPSSTRSGRTVISVGGELRLARGDALPIRTEFAADPIRALLGAPSAMSPHERAVVQILARPVTSHRARRAQRIRGRRGRRWVSRALDLLNPSNLATHRSAGQPMRNASDPQTRLEYSAQDRAIAAKRRGTPYETVVRYAFAIAMPSGSGKADAAAAREAMRGRAHATASAFATYTEHNQYRRHRLGNPLPVLASRQFRRGDLLSVPELAAIAHLPTDDAIPGLQRAGARAAMPPPGIPTRGQDIKPLGISDSGQPRPVGLRVADARHHMHILGATGSGKSELMGQLILDDADNGRGIVVIDPKGDLVTDILGRLPRRFADRVVLFDADSRSQPPCINPLEGEDQARTVDNLASIFSRVYAASWGPRTDDVLRSGLMTLTAQAGTPTLADLPKLLTVPAFRARAMDAVNNDVLAGFWHGYDQLSDAARAQVIAPLMNKLRGFLLRPFVYGTLAGGHSTVDLDQILDGGICLVRLAKDALGMETARLVGSIIVARTWQAATRRARLPQRERHDAGLYIDECHNFLNLPYALEDMLAEARAYRLGIVLAHQYLSQLTPELEQGISTNARSKLYLNASPEDARHLARHTEPRLSEHDLSHLGAFHAAARLVLHGEETPAFTLRTEKMRPAIPGRARAIRAAARANIRSANTATTTPATPETRTTALNDPRRVA